MSLPSDPSADRPLNTSERIEALLQDLLRFPWKSTALTLRERFREDHLGLTASSLTFTSTMALVPLVTVALAVFTAFPMFSRFQDVLQKWLMESLIPDNIARQVLGYLTQFASQSTKLGGAGVALLLVTALALIMTIDHTLNSIWRVRTPRSFGQRLLVYWAALTVGPLLLGAVIAAYLPSLLQGVQPRGRSHGLQFQLAIEVLKQLEGVRASETRGLTMEQLTALLRIDALQLEPVLETLCELDWVGMLQEELATEDARYVLLADPGATALAPLLDALLLHRQDITRNLWDKGNWASLKLRDAL